ncbi:twin-arginine translocase TatA/TatE family subunit [Patulibacter minatonensis]|uniref:twin-arginine translocase TatA/TatE family subunit n=1 Tax=Patulibacter minatonensis TaxID=298163 RepID=UPI0005667FF0|nr:twin-arginine translocase TatA/TatE family subunit [Patulibacter minatonensis]
MGSGLLQPTHIIVLLVIALLVLGPKRLPEVGKSLGEGLKSFKSSLDGHDDEPQVRRASAEPTPAPTEATAAPARTED